MLNLSRRGSHTPARSLLLFSAIALLVLIGAACGSSSASSSSSSASSAAAAATSATTSTPAVAGASTSPTATPQSSEAGEYGSSTEASPSSTPESSEAGEYGSSPAASPATGSATTAEVKTSKDAKLGTILTDAAGRTLYIYKKDTMNVSNCSGGCAQNWPPLTTSGTPTIASGVAGTLGTITRSDGTKQVTYNGMPLYYFRADSKPGDTKGQDIGDVWYVVTPSAH